jgi:hypothetical protein
LPIGIRARRIPVGDKHDVISVLAQGELCSRAERRRIYNDALVEHCEGLNNFHEGPYRRRRCEQHVVASGWGRHTTQPRLI